MPRIIIPAKGLRLTLTVVLVWGCLYSNALGEPVFQVSPGFKIQPVADTSAISFPMFATLDDNRRLYVTESSGNDLYAELKEQVRKCRVSFLQDRDGDGVYETATIFADKLTPSMGLVWHNGKLYIADPPDLVTLEDTDGDGHADKRTVVLTGFGHTDNGSLHGLTFGPDGWLYFTTGNPDGYDLHGPDGSHTRGQVGALLRCQADGSGVETISRGFENLVEIVFLPDGSIIGTDTWFQLPESGVRDALVHLLEEGQYPIHAVDQTVPHLQFNATLPAVALFPAVAHSGLEIYHGTAFPREMRGCLFSAQHNARKIVRHQLAAKGSSYTAETFDFVTTEDPDVHFSDVLQDTDGSLLIVDTGSWYVQHCPTGRIRQAPARGAIYRVSFESPSSTPVDVAAPAVGTNWLANLTSSNPTVVAAAARMLGRLSDTNAAPALSRLLQSPNPALKLAAAEAIPRCGSSASVPDILAAFVGETDVFLEHALTLALYRLASVTTLLSALDNPNPRLQRAALLLLDQPPFRAAPSSAVIARLNAPNLSLRDTARWVLLRHREWEDAGAAFLRQLIALPNPSDPDRRALAELLPLFATNPPVAAAIAEVLSPANHDSSDDQRARLLDAVAALDLRPPPLSVAQAILHLLQKPGATTALPAVRAAGALRVEGVEDTLAAIARDSTDPPALRLEATRELVRRRPILESEQMEFLLAQLSATNLPTARLAAAEVLTTAKLSSLQTIMLLKAVRGDSVIAPVSILEAAQRTGLQPDCAVALLDYVAASLDAGWTFSTDQLTKLQVAVPESQRATADALLTRLTQAAAHQRQQLTDLAPLLTGGDHNRGEKIFFEKGQCITCHRIWENGGRVGPDLSRVGAIRSGRDILESVLIPSATIAQAYDTLNVTTTDGETYTGVRVGTADNPLRLRLASGTEMVLHPSQIERIDRSKVSLMPEGLLKNLQSEEIRDLLAFLQHLK